MNELENNNNLETELTTFQEEIVTKVTKKNGTKGYILTPLEASIQSRRNTLNFPALQAMFELSEVELQTILDKLPPVEDCNC